MLFQRFTDRIHQEDLSAGDRLSHRLDSWVFRVWPFRSFSMKQTMLGLVLASIAGVAMADVPSVNATCPGEIEVHADEGGPVYINGKEAKLKTLTDNSFEAKGAGVTVSLTVRPDGSADVSYTGKGGKHGICPLADED
jgi:hypothetical protein